MKYKLLGVLEVIKLILIPLIILNFVVYLCGTFIAWNPNPMDWLLLKTIIGRVILVFIELLFISTIPKFWDEFN